MAMHVERIRETIDECFSRNDVASAEKYLNLYYEEAKETKQIGALVFLTNELVGFHRKQGNREKALNYAKEVMKLCEEHELDTSVAGATSYLNAATAYKAFDMSEKAIPLFKKAEEIYNRRLDSKDPKKAGLYNNMALAYCDLGEYDKAKELYIKAIEIMGSLKNGELDTAISYLNLANVYEKEKGLIEADEDIKKLLEKAQELLDTKKDIVDGYNAFVCEKCAPTFGYYGYFLYENELKERARRIYERD